MNLEDFVKFTYGRAPISKRISTGANISGAICAVAARNDDAVWGAGCVAEATGGYTPIADETLLQDAVQWVSLSAAYCKTGTMQVYFFPEGLDTRADNAE